MASSIPYNNDVDMTPDDNLSNQTYDVQIDDDSSHGSVPSVDPIPVSDTSTRIIDNWVKDLTPTGGREGDKYNDTPPTEKSPIPEPVYKTVTRKVRESIKDYSQSYLRELYNRGAKFYVIYTDGTENEVSYTEIHDPHQIQTGTYINEAQQIADAVNQHFWHDDNGAHVTDVEQDDWKTAANANFNDLSDSKPYHNILMNSLGILLRRALYNLVAISKSAVTFYDGLGNDLANIRASFGSDGATFRKNGKTKATITTQGLSIYDNDGSVSGNNETLGSRLAFIGVDGSGKPYSRIGKSAKGYIDIGVNSSNNGYIDFYNGSNLLAHIGYDAGTNISGGTSLAPYYNLGLRKASSTIGNYSLSEGYYTVASGYASHAEGYDTEASSSEAHAEGYGTKATWQATHAEGYSSKANGHSSHAEGIKTYTGTNGRGSHSEGIATSAQGDASHAEGIGQISSDNGYIYDSPIAYTTASGVGSHAEGYSTTASGDYSHAEGQVAQASGKTSHAEGTYSKASGAYSHAEGSNTTVKTAAVCGHAEGYQTTVSNKYSHAEGYVTEASGEGSHTEGHNTTASGEYSHAEGLETTASGDYSHASGCKTKADQSYMTAVGYKNQPSVKNALFAVGNGFPTAQGRNAFTVISKLGEIASVYIKGSSSSDGETVTSDARIKTLINELTPETSIKFIKQLQPKHYYKYDVEEYGFYAQEVEEIPEFGKVLVTKDNSGLYDLPDYRLLNYQGMIAPIVSVEQDLIDRVEQLEAENKELKLQNEKLNKRLNNIEQILANLTS